MDGVVPVASPPGLPEPAAAESGLPTGEPNTGPLRPKREPEETGAPVGRPEASGTARQTASAAPVISSEPAEEDDFEEDPACTDFPDQGAVRTTLLRVPDEIVAGSGWRNFTLRIANTSDRLLKSVDAYVMNAIYTPEDDYKNLEYLVTLEWYDQDTGTWEAAETGYGQRFELLGLSPGAHIDIELRIKVDAKVLTGWGSVAVEAVYRDENDVCGRVGGDDDTQVTSRDFAIVAADSGPPTTMTPVKSDEPAAPGHQPARPESRKDTDAATSGAGPADGLPGVTEEPGSPAASDASLAHTGSGSAAKWLLGAGGTSIALGSALAVAARRRRHHNA
ncbi:LPXTG cell wall anchor domain-containing protein [Streptomyces sp. NPDC006854]|uniref:LPXTG cell wall anchor domain-containing protein n=1 Tax=Streptomyces sp. NPDC006854 TaxID=3155115 RepID=UPI0033EA9813